MKDWKEQARINNFEITQGECQLCGGHFVHGVEECVAVFDQIIHFLNHDEGIKYMTIFLSVDAHTLSHAEIHGRWNNHFHLTRLHLILAKKIKWTYKLSPLLSDVVNTFKLSNANSIIVNPPLKIRGKITLANFNHSFSNEEYVQFINTWSNGVYESFSSSLDMVESIAESFLKKYENIVYNK